ncbi:MAG: hypothetical protein EOP56_04915 [Sphingobacteriales bacterium]|nr:MAG: hypothetical protein EOP56_04915 [Sphingobacteriales bacterium]
MRKFLIAALLTAVAVSPFACKKVDDGVRLHMNTSITSTTVIVNVANQATGDAITSNLKVKVRGQDADQVFTYAGDKAFECENGKVVLTLKAHAMSSDNATFSVLIYGSGFIPVTTEVSVSTKYPHYETSVEIMNVSNPPAGTKIRSFSMQARCIWSYQNGCIVCSQNHRFGLL